MRIDSAYCEECYAIDGGCGHADWNGVSVCDLCGDRSQNEYLAGSLYCRNCVSFYIRQWSQNVRSSTR